MCATFTKSHWKEWSHFLSCFGTTHSENSKPNAKKQLTDQNEKWNYSGVCVQQLQAVAKGCSVLEIFVYVFVLVVNNFVYLYLICWRQKNTSDLFEVLENSHFSLLPVQGRTNVLVGLILYERNLVYSIFLELLCLFSSLNKCCVIES